MNDVEASCKIERETYDNQRRYYFHLARSMLAVYPGIKSFDVATKLCDDDYCYAILDDTVMYQDSSHLSREGSKYIGQFIAPMIEQAVTQQSSQTP